MEIPNIIRKMKSENIETFKIELGSNLLLAPICYLIFKYVSIPTVKYALFAIIFIVGLYLNFRMLKNAEFIANKKQKASVKFYYKLQLWLPFIAVVTFMIWVMMLETA